MLETILNILAFILVFLILTIPLLYIIYLCNRIIKCDKDMAILISERNNKFFLVIYILFPPVLWYRLTQIVLKRKRKSFNIIITIFLLYWFLIISDLWVVYSGKIPYGTSLSYILFYLFFYIMPLLFIVRYFQIRKN